MTTSIIEKFESKLGSEDFVSPAKLVNCGMYGSRAAVRNALDKGVFPFLKVSSHRVLIPRESVLEYLRKSLHA